MTKQNKKHPLTSVNQIASELKEAYKVSHKIAFSWAWKIFKFGYSDTVQIEFIKQSTGQRTTRIGYKLETKCNKQLNCYLNFISKTDNDSPKRAVVNNIISIVPIYDNPTKSEPNEPSEKEETNKYKSKYKSTKDVWATAKPQSIIEYKGEVYSVVQNRQKEYFKEITIESLQGVWTTLTQIAHGGQTLKFSAMDSKEFKTAQKELQREIDRQLDSELESEPIQSIDYGQMFGVKNSDFIQ